MTLWEIVLLSLLQGATEFLPVSSSGHLVLAEALWGSQAAKDGIFFEVLVHVGTLLAICFVFRATLARLLRYAFLEGPALTRRQGIRAAWVEEGHGRMILAILLATCITGVIGLTLKDFFKARYADPHFVGYALIATAALLGATRLSKRRQLPADQDELGGFPYPLALALAVALAQTTAILPGISRSGATISVALLLGMRRRHAGEFSFLIAVPAILGALASEAADLGQADAGPGIGWGGGLVALAVSAFSGWVFLRLLLRFVRGGQFAWFGLYCLAVGAWALWRF